MDPALKAGLPKLFVLEGGQTAATRDEVQGEETREKIWNILLKEYR